MNGPEIIYLQPSENTTDARERLLRAETTSIILVVPPDTQLSNALAWRQLHARMRLEGKDVLVVSADDRIRTIASTAGFDVKQAYTSSANDPRPADGLDHTGMRTRTPSRSPDQVMRRDQKKYATRAGQMARPDPGDPSAFGQEQAPREEQRGLVGTGSSPLGVNAAAGEAVSPSLDFEEAAPASKPDAESPATTFPAFEQEIVIEDLGDQEAVLTPEEATSNTWTETTLSATGGMGPARASGRPPAPGNQERATRTILDVLGELLPPDPPLREAPTSPTAGLGLSRGHRHEPQRETRPARGTPDGQAASHTQLAATTRKIRTVTIPPERTHTTPGGKRPRRPGAVPLALAALAVLALAALVGAFVGWNATVTVTVRTQALHLSHLQFEASSTTRDPQHDTIPSQVLTYPASVTGQGTASGTTQQGQTAATGSVIFTNTGKQAVDIPTGTILTTSGSVAVQFATTADVLIEPAGSGGPDIPVPIQAQNAGGGGSVAANTINTIPPASIAMIAQNSSTPTASVILTVTNPSATSGGGTANVPAATDSDIVRLKQALHQQLRIKISAWMMGTLRSGDVQGTVMPDILGSATPLPEEKLTTTTAAGQAAPNGKFGGVLSVTVSALVIHYATIRAFCRARLAAAALQLNPALVLAPQMPAVTVTDRQASADGTTLAITVDTTGRIMQRVMVEEIRSLVAGKSVAQAKGDLPTGKGGIIGIQIDVSPSFLPFLPLREEQIQVDVHPEPLVGADS